MLLSDDEATAFLVTGPPLTIQPQTFTLEIDGIMCAEDDEDVIEDFAEIYSLRDNVRPEAGEIEFVDPVTIQFDLSEMVNANNAAGAIDINQFVGIYDSNNVLQSGFAAAGDSTLLFGNQPFFDTVEVDVSALTPGEDYYVRIQGLRDLAQQPLGTLNTGNLISPNPTDLHFTMPVDNEAPEIADVTVVGHDGTDGYIRVDFSEVVNLQAVAVGPPQEPFNFFVNGVPQNAVVGAPAAANDYQIVLPLPAVAKSDFVILRVRDLALGLQQIAFNSYEDVSGNVGAARTFFRTMAAADPMEVVSVEYKFVAPGVNVVDIEFDRDVAALSGNPITGTRLFNAVTFPKTIAAGDQAAVIVDGKSVLRIDLDTAPYAPGDYTLDLDADHVTDLVGQGNAAETITFTYPAEPVVPVAEVVAVNQNPGGAGLNVIDVVFQYPGAIAAPMDPATALDVSNYAIEGNNVFTNAIFWGAQNVVRLTMPRDSILVAGDYMFSVTGVIDAQGTPAADYNQAETLARSAQPHMISADVDAINEVLLTFNENIVQGGGSALAANMFEVRVDGTVVAATPTQPGPTNEILLTLAAPLPAPGVEVTVTTTAAFDWEAALDNNPVRTGQTITAGWPAGSLAWFE